MKVSELTGEQLDYWTAKAQGWVADKDIDGDIHWRDATGHIRYWGWDYTPDRNKAQAFELIEAFEIDLGPFHSKQWIASLWSGNEEYSMIGVTPQEAICRAVVASVYGEGVGG